MEAQIFAVELNESFVLLALLFCSLFSCWAEHMTLKRYKKKWDVQKVKAFSEIASLIGMEHIHTSTDRKDVVLQEVYRIAIREIRDEPWFVLNEADKLLQKNRRSLFVKRKGESNNER